MALESDSTILVSVDVSTNTQPARSLVDLCRSVDVVLIGYYPDRGQVAPTEVRQDRKSEVASSLREMADTFRDGGVGVTETLAFAYYRQNSIDYAAKKHGCDAVLSLGGAERIERILAPIRGETNLKRIVGLLGAAMRDSDAEVTFFHAVTEHGDPGHGEFLIRGAADRLTQAGIDRDRIGWQLSEDASPGDEIVELGAEHDLIVLGETEPSLRDRIFGSVQTRIVDEVDAPTFVVRDTDDQ